MSQFAFAPSHPELASAPESDADLRTAAVLSCDRSDELVPLPTLWQRLVDGRLRVVDDFSSERRSYAMLEAPSREGARPTGLKERAVAVLARVLQGQPQKTIALDMGAAPSTIASAAAQCLGAMGFRCSAARAPALLVKLYHAHATGCFEERATSTLLRCGVETYRVIGTSRPDRTLPSILSDAEQAVVRKIIEGRSNREIGQARRTSVHTIAKQVASAFRKLDVDSRSALLWKLVSTSVDG